MEMAVFAAAYIIPYSQCKLNELKLNPLKVNQDNLIKYTSQLEVAEHYYGY